MPTISQSVSVAASTTNDNVLSGSQFEFAPYPCMLQIGVAGDANGADLAVDVYSGSDLLVEGMRLNTKNQMPTIPDDFIVQDVIDQGERLKIRVRNTSAAGARTAFFTVILTPMMG